jgi:hypothetical protein
MLVHAKHRQMCQFQLQGYFLQVSGVNPSAQSHRFDASLRFQQLPIDDLRR